MTHAEAWLATGVLGTMTAATTSDVADALRFANGLDPRTVALWTILPGVLAGMSLLTISPPKESRVVFGELVASGLAAFVAGAIVMSTDSIPSTVWTLLIAGVGAGAGGSKALHYFHERWSKSHEQ